MDIPAFLMGKMNAGRQWKSTFKNLKKNDFQFGVLYIAKLSTQSDVPGLEKFISHYFSKDVLPEDVLPENKGVNQEKSSLDIGNRTSTTGERQRDFLG